MSSSDLVVACVNVGDFCGRGSEYVRKLQAGVKRHLPIPHRFICVTDDDPRNQWDVENVPAMKYLHGWWQKLALFAPGMLPPGRVLYFDLDTVIVGDLTPLTEYRGDFAMLTDFIRGTPSSAIMAWPEGFGSELWSAYEREGFPQKSYLSRDGRRGDQDWIAEHYPNPVRLQDQVDGLLASWVHCRDGLPEGARAVSFWGIQRPHQTDGWVQREWRE